MCGGRQSPRTGSYGPITTATATKRYIRYQPARTMYLANIYDRFTTSLCSAFLPCFPSCIRIPTWKLGNAQWIWKPKPKPIGQDKGTYQDMSSQKRASGRIEKAVVSKSMCVGPAITPIRTSCAEIRCHRSTVV